MNKNIFAATVAAFAGVASAQSTVTLFGVVDVDIDHFSQNGVSRTMLSHSGNAPSQIGFRGTEDLGDGLSANFWLASSTSPDDGGTRPMDFAFRSTVSLAGPFGEVRLGRDYPPGSLNQGVFDPFRNMGPASGANITLPVLPGVLGTGSNPTTSIRVSNSIQYLWGFAANAQAVVGTGFYGSVMVALPENVTGKPPIGRYAGGRAGYAVGPWNVAVAYAESKGPFGTLGPRYGTPTTFKESNLGAWYQFDNVKLMGHVGANDSDVPNTRFTHWAVGTEITIGAGYIPLSYIAARQNNAANSSVEQIAAGYVYFLSRRTSLYTSIAHIKNKNGATFSFVGGNGGSFPALTPGLITSKGNGTGYDFGMRHYF
ncbi:MULTISPECIES: porin [unclassified Variovorax]|uniref:porin n=1 Tax=unclassified Variovorax TaxID=663243 RepID=UPI001BD3DDC6|nr:MULTISPECIES: porin [unclassified Variovorax]